MRLAPPYGRRINRDRPVGFRFEGREVAGYAGDTIASALAANGQMMLSRSFKYHRPRGAFGMAGAEANTLVQVGAEPNVQADLCPVAEGMEVSAQNVAGSLAFDRDAVIGLFARFLPVGFYYRTFMGPTRGAWFNLWEPRIRAKAGLGRIDTAARFAVGDKGHLHCDVLVVGGGPAGLAAAAEAARGSADVILCEAGPQVGGTMNHAKEPDVATDLPRSLCVMTGTTCTGWFADNWLSLLQRDTLWRVRARQVIFAVGGIEQPAVFRNNDLPGILSAGAVQRLIRLYAVAPGRQAVVLAGTPEGLDAAEAMQAAGIAISALVLPRNLPGHEARIDALSRAGASVVTGRIEEASGRGRVARVRVGKHWYHCDVVAVSVGQAPAWHLPCQAGATLGHDTVAKRFSLRLDRPGTDLAGTVNGYAGLAAVKADGRRAGRAALGALGRPFDHEVPLKDPEAALAFWHQPLEPNPRGKDFVDFDEDLQVADLVNAVAEGYRELELVKRFTTVGMGPSQGRHSALATARIVAEATSREVAEVGVATARPPAMPEALGTLAGHGHTPERRTALHTLHTSLGAEMKPAGGWWRPYLYGRGVRTDLINDEVAAVRNAAGLLDVSSLGKLEVRGPDAGEFLDRIYTMAHGNQPVGRVRYCLMLNEMGAVIDDGVALRLAEDRFYVTATTGAVARVYADMALWNAQWGLQVDVANLTGAFAGLNITGPGARAVVQALSGSIDWSRESFPYLSGREGVVAGVPVRAMRIGFTGELSYELHCPASHAPALWDAVMATGSVRPYGLEASRLLRLEKGHILIGQDTDALSSPDELGMGWALSSKKPFYVGKRSVEMRRRMGVTRRLAALSFPPGTSGLGEGCLVLADGVPAGHLTSVATSPTLGHPIALGYVPAGLASAGAVVNIRSRTGQSVAGTVAGHAFHDPDNTRQEVP